MEPDPAPALSRGLALLRQLETDGPSSLERLAGATGLPKSSVLRLLRTLELARAVRRDGQTKRYHALVRLTPTGSGGDSLTAAAGPVMERLCGETAQTVELHMVEGHSLLMIDRREPLDALVSAKARIGSRRDVSELEALAQVLFAWDAAPMPGKPWRWSGGKKVTVPAAERKRLLERARQRRVAAGRTTNPHHVRRYAGPVLGSDGRLLAVLALAQVCGPGDRGPRSELEKLTRDAAAEVTQLLDIDFDKRTGGPAPGRPARGRAGSLNG